MLTCPSQNGCVSISSIGKAKMCKCFDGLDGAGKWWAAGMSLAWIFPPKLQFKNKFHSGVLHAKTIL